MQNTFSKPAKSARSQSYRPSIKSLVFSNSINSSTIQQQDIQTTPRQFPKDKWQQSKPKSEIIEKQSQKMKDHLNQEQISKLKACFEKFSSTKTLKKPPRSKLNANGVRQIIYNEPQIDITLTEKQLNQVFIEAEVPIHKQTLAHIYAQVGRKKPGKGICFDDLLELIKLPNGSQQNDADYQQLFRLYDRKNRGFFDYQDYKFVCEGISKQLNDAQIHFAFKGIDRSNSGKINYQEFIQIMKGKID